MKITWIVQNLILSILHMMVIAGKNFKTSETSKNNSFPPMRSLRLTISVYEWAKMSSNAHYRWLDHPQESAGRQDLVNESKLSLSKNYKKYNLVLKENFLDLATLEEVRSMGEWSAPEFIWNGIQDFKNYSKFTTFSTKTCRADEIPLLEVTQLDSLEKK